MSELTCTRCGDYYIPDLKLSEQPEAPIGKYGRMRQRYLKEHLYKSDHTMDAQIAYAVNQINAHEGKISISHLMNEVNLCQRHFERKFKLHTGFTPQKYNSIVRFKNAIKILRNESSDNLLSVAVKAGYYDASHLSREVKKLSGSTPNFFLSLPPDNETTIIYTK